MGHSVSRLLFHVIFATKRRERSIGKALAGKLESYIVGIVNNLGGKALAVGVQPEHCHLLAEVPAAVSVATLTAKVKANSSRFAKTQKGVPGDFGWQEGYMGVTVSPSDKSKVMAYISDQEEHHRRRTYAEECEDVLRKFGVTSEELGIRR